jgi:mannose-6-phosphate isomerase-like protein (cupin superfamily)
MGQEVRNAGVLATDQATEYDFRVGCRILELANSAADPGLSNGRARLATGTTTRWHRPRETSKRYVILSGRGRVELGGPCRRPRPGRGAVVQIPPLCRQRISPSGPQERGFPALCTPRFQPECYEDLAEERGSG